MHKLLSISLAALALSGCISSRGGDNADSAPLIPETLFSGPIDIPKPKEPLKFVAFDSIKGDFDGDGRPEYLWIEGYRDEDGFYENPHLLMKSSNPRIPTDSIWASATVTLQNLGDLDGSGCDAIGIIPYFGSNFTGYSVNRLKDGKWVEMIEPFTIFAAKDQEWVRPSKRPGYVEITYYNSDAPADPEVPDNMWTPHTKEVKLKTK